jgi:starch-binding outer membrane protein, SusD/RagB family
VYDAVDEVRERAGLDGLPDNLTKEQMRAKIKNERRLELLLEEHRFYDLRRWKDGDVLKQPILGMKVYDRQNNGQQEYVIEQIEERKFTGNNYYLPIPLKEQERNPLLKD